ncbi:PepSY domain-containing protein [Methanolobus psychrotolerans]|uniref:PepSY domain-containing protein n=1 Tax=Methanolobus psychrotolerans TaxID=1874706 RepID=UPI000B915781|nr:PepSY domain-containing protein [Methanolobus psychrotolerans]
MKRTTSILLVGMLITAIAGIGIVNAAVDRADDATFFGQMHRWAANRMGYSGGYGYENCPVYGAYASDGTTVAGLEVGTIDEAIKLAEDATGKDIGESNIYLMGKWWVFNYTDDEDVIKQGRIDAYTGDVIEDFYASSSYKGLQYSQNVRGMMRGSGYGTAGCYRY